MTDIDKTVNLVQVVMRIETCDEQGRPKQVRIIHDDDVVDLSESNSKTFMTAWVHGTFTERK